MAKKAGRLRRIVDLIQTNWLILQREMRDMNIGMVTVPMTVSPDLSHAFL